MLLLPLLVACHPGPADTVYPRCVNTPTDLAADAVSAGGFSAVDILAFTTGARAETLTWDHGSTTPLSLEVVADGTGTRWIDSVADYTGVSIDIGIECTSRLEIPATLDFATEDGAFAEAFDTTLTAAVADAATIDVDLVAASLAGTFDPADWPTEDYDTLDMHLVAWFTPAGDSGTISGSAEKDEGCDGDTCSASSEQLEVATWGEPST